MTKSELIQKINGGFNPSFTFFWGTKNANGYLSQWHHAPFTINKMTFENCEKWMMYQKAILFNDIKIANEIYKISNPKQIKALGRKVSNFNKAAWDYNKYIIVRNGNYHKFSQNEKLKEMLKATGDSILVEASPYDDIWGIGLKKDDKNAKRPDNWKGENLLGFALMDVRSKL
jgi:ribA/ribD-fused uncharacterized protein